MKTILRSAKTQCPSRAATIRVGSAIWVAVFALCVAVAASAQPIIRYVDCDVPSSGDGASWATAKKTISSSVGDAPDGAQIWVAEGTYWETLSSWDNLSLYGGFAGNESSLEERDILAHRTIVRANRPSYVIAMGNNTRLDGFTITGGLASPPNDASGGGILCAHRPTSVTIENCTITGNTASYAGGGVYCLESCPEILNCTITNNTAFMGAGIAMDNCFSPTIQNCRFANNTAAETGGGLTGRWSGPVVVDCVFESNFAAQTGGGVDFFDCEGALVSNCTILGNYARLGAGVWSNVSAPSIGNCLIVGNSGETGAGIYSLLEPHARLVNNTVAGNSAYVSGSVHCNASSPFLANCILSGNRAVVGGAMVLDAASAPTILNCTIADNSADQAGGIFCLAGSNPPVTNTIFANNRNRAVEEADASADPIVNSCLFFGNPEGDYYDEGTALYTGAAAIDANVLGAQDTVDGDPHFAIRSRVWTANGAYDPDTNRTTLHDSAPGYGAGALVDSLIEVAPGAPYTLITGNAAADVEVFGDFAAQGTSGATYRLIDYDLWPESAALDAATSVGAMAYSIDHKLRPVNQASLNHWPMLVGHDIGAYETQGAPQGDLGVIVHGSLDFGLFQGGGPVERRVEIVNEGLQTVFFTGLGIRIEWVSGRGPAYFYLSPMPDTSPLAPGESRDVYVQFCAIYHAGSSSGTAGALSRAASDPTRAMVEPDGASPGAKRPKSGSTNAVENGMPQPLVTHALLVITSSDPARPTIELPMSGSAYGQTSVDSAQWQLYE